MTDILGTTIAYELATMEDYMRLLNSSAKGRKNWLIALTFLLLTAANSTAQTNQKVIRIGFIPLTDCASVVMAQELGLYKKYGVNVVLSKETSWANLRDKILTGELEAAHCLFAMPLSVYTGIGGPKGKEMKIAMVLSENGQATTLSQSGFGNKVAYGDLKGFKTAFDTLKATKVPTFAMTFPGGTHDIWLRYGLAAAGINQKDVRIITIPPPQMVANMQVNNMDGYNVGEPWGGVAVKQKIGFTWLASQDIWTDHPEKALVVNADFAAQRRDDLKKVMKAILEASIWLDDLNNRDKAAKILGSQAFVNAPADVIDARLHGTYDLGGNLGEKTFSKDTMKFYDKGLVNFPRKSYANWFLAQYLRFGLIKDTPDFTKISNMLILQDLYQEVAKEMKIPVPADDMKPFTIKLDNIRFDPNHPLAAYAN